MATTPDKLQPVTVAADGLLIGIGGGKDSLMSVELLKQHYPRIATWSLNHRAQLEPLIKRIGLEHFWVERAWDPLIAQHNEQGAYNGHVPISAIFACVGTVVAVLSGYRDVVVSNEASANEPTLMYKGHAINHQYSKSLEFEQDYHALLAKNYDQTLRYYSFLRPLSELYIVELFSKHYFNTYKDVFSSCNRAFVHGSNELFWCGECAKCAFMFLMLTPFNDISDIEALWQGKNLLQEPRLEATYNQLLGIAGDKPLDCVGEVKESRAAMRLAQKLYPQLNKYSFSIPPEYDYRQLATHSMPAELYTILQQTTQRP